MTGNFLLGNLTPTYNIVEIAIYITKLRTPLRSVADLQILDCRFVKCGSLVLPDEASCN
jgi:hypothetical protein